MSKKRYDVVAVTGQYRDKDGNEKNRYMNCGAVIRTDKGFSLKLEAIPIESNGWFMLFEPKEKDKAQPAETPANDEPFDDDIPF